MSRVKKLITNTIILIFGTVLPKIGTFLVLPILTAVLTKAEYGTYDLVISGLSFIIPIVSLQIEQAVFRYLIDAKDLSERKDIITNSAIYILFASTILCLGGIILLKDYSLQIKLMIIAYATLNLFYHYILQVCRGIGQLKLYSQITIINSTLNILLIILLVGKIKMGLLGLFLSLNIPILVAILYGSLTIHIGTLISFNDYKFQSLNKLLKYSIPLLPNSISWWIVGLSDRWIITSLMGVEANAIYAVSNKIPNLFNLIYNNFNLAWQESASKSKEDDDMDAYYSSVFNTIYNFLFGMIILLITTSPVIFKIFIDDSYGNAYYQMPILFISVFLHCFCSFYGGVYIAFKKSEKLAFSAFLGAILNITINYLFIRKIGLYAASISTLVSYLIIALYRAKDVTKYVSIDYNFKKITVTVIVVVLISAVSYINNLYLNIINFIIALTFSIVVNKKIIIGILNRALLKIRSKN